MMLEQKDWIVDTTLDPNLLPDGLSKRQGQIILYIYNCIQACGYSPSIREIGKATDIPSTSVVNYNLIRLARKGYLIRTEAKSRAMRLLPAGYQFVYSICPEERKSDPAMKMQQLQREISYLHQSYENQLRDVEQERDALRERLKQIERLLIN